MDLQKFSIEWENADDVRKEILNSRTIEKVEEIFSLNTLHPLSLYARLDFGLINENKGIVQDSMNKVLNFIYEPFPNYFFNLPTNDPIGEIMLKPLIQYPLNISPINDPNIQNYINWILVGYAHLFMCFRKHGIEAYDSLRTLGAAIEQNSEHLAFLIFGDYLRISNYADAYTKYLVFTFLSSGLGFQKHGNNNDEFFKLTNEAKRYGNWLIQRTPTKDLATVFDEGQAIAIELFNKIMDDIESKNIIISELKVPKI